MWTTELENGAAPVKSAPMMTVPVFSLTEGTADAICKLCRPKMDVVEPSSTSGSEDTDANAPDVREREES